MLYSPEYERPAHDLLAARSASSLGARTRLALRRDPRAHRLVRQRDGRFLETPRDRIVWDVGHQTYAHKMLTGRADASPRSASTGACPASCSGGVRTRHRRHRSRLDVDSLRAGHRRGCEAGPGTPRARRMRARRRGADGRRRLRGAEPGRPPKDAARRGAQRQRDVDQAQRRRHAALSQPAAPRPGSDEDPRGDGTQHRALCRPSARAPTVSARTSRRA